MKLIKMKNGYVNADMIESFAVIEHESYCDIVAYTPSYGGDCECYNLGKCTEESEAYMRLRLLANSLIEAKFGIFDVMIGCDDDHAKQP